MDKIGIRGGIWLFFLEGKTIEEIHERIAPTLNDSCPSYEIVRTYLNEFKRGRKSIEDVQCSGTPKTTVMLENIDKADDIILVYRRVEVRK